ncbi:MFS transporter [Virgisporangium aliadipatigenens]|uniref:MFS transporter n=1 Tax=Virgisporangium aliadipatigenens TaxID=741659 RepID=A0A8J3YSF0_9ACTN|nr:MFS transporter [Virgisporangium aliadipatigenens]GIJ48893.1 MFS transporter [Virgisporangium aliadipatigenens]
MVSTDAKREPLLTGPVLALLGTVVGALASFYLLLSVVPEYAVRGGWGTRGAGLCTAALMFGTVLTELAAPALIGRFGYRSVITVALLLLGAPAVGLAFTASGFALVAACLLRGAGIGVVFVAGSALAAELAPPGRRGEVLGIFGVAAGAPSIVFLPSGVWLSEHIGYAPVFVTAGALALLATLAVRRLPAAPMPAAEPGSAGGLGALTVAFGVIATAAGVLPTFLPLGTRLAALALLIQSCVTPFARWAVSRAPERHHRPLLLAGVALASAGVLGMVRAADVVPLVVASVLFGAGFGMVQHVTLALMFARVPTSGYRRVSMLWNIAYDAGMGVGAVAFGALVARNGFAPAYALLAAVMLAVLLPLARATRRA